MYCHQRNTYDLGMARFPKRVLNAQTFEKCISHHSNVPIVRYGNTKYPGVYPSFTKAFFTITNIQIATWLSEPNVHYQSNT